MRFQRDRSGLYLPDRELIAKPRQGIPYLAAAAAGGRRPVIAGGGAGTLRFQSGWESVSPGSTVAIVRDTDKWDGGGSVIQNGPEQMDVAAAPAGAPAGMSNMLRQYYYDSAPGLFITGMPAVGIGDTRHMRFYFRDQSTFVPTDPAAVDQHIWLPSPNQTHWAIVHSPPGGDAYLSFVVYDGATQHRYRYNGIDSSTMYKLRFSVTRLSTTAFTVSCGLWLVDGTPVAVDSDLSCSHHGPAHNLDPEEVHTQPDANWASWTGMRVSIEGAGSSTFDPDVDYVWIGGIVFLDNGDPSDYGVWGDEVAA